MSLRSLSGWRPLAVAGALIGPWPWRTSDISLVWPIKVSLAKNRTTQWVNPGRTGHFSPSMSLLASDLLLSSFLFFRWYISKRSYSLVSFSSFPIPTVALCHTAFLLWLPNGVSTLVSLNCRPPSLSDCCHISDSRCFIVSIPACIL